MLTYIIIAVAAGFWLLIAARAPRRLVWLLLLWLPIQGWLQLNVFNDSNLTVLLYEVMVIGIFAVFALRAARSPQTFGIPRILWFALPFTIWTLLLVPSSLATEGALTTLIGLRTYLLPIPLVWIGYRAFETRRHLEALAWVLMLQMPLIAAVTVSQVLGLSSASGAVFNVPVGFMVAGIIRPPGTFSAPGHLGTYLLFVIPLAIGLLALRTELWKRVVFASGMVGAIIALLANTQRITVVLLVVVVPLMLLVARRARALTGVVLAVSVLAAALSLGNEVLSRGFRGRVNTIQDDFYQTVIATPAALMSDALRTPVFGDGLGIASPGAARLDAPIGTRNTQPLQTDRPAENFAVALVYQTGVPGLMLFCWFVAVLVRDGWRAVRACRHSDLVLLGAAILGFEVAVCLQSWSYSPLHYPPARVLFWFWAGVLLSLPRLAAAAPARGEAFAAHGAPALTPQPFMRPPVPSAARWRPSVIPPRPTPMRNRRG